jgi:hypothetical protein
MFEYTKEEESLLTTMLTAALNEERQQRMHETLERYIGQPNTHTTRAMLSSRVEQIMSEEDAKFLKIMDTMMAPGIRLTALDQMPLYINDPDLVIRTIAIWRLKIAK